MIASLTLEISVRVGAANQIFSYEDAMLEMGR
jgi:hypothetical protein